MSSESIRRPCTTQTAQFVTDPATNRLIRNLDGHVRIEATYRGQHRVDVTLGLGRTTHPVTNEAQAKERFQYAADHLGLTWAGEDGEPWTTEGPDITTLQGLAYTDSDVDVLLYIEYPTRWRRKRVDVACDGWVMRTGGDL